MQKNATAKTAYRPKSTQQEQLNHFGIHPKRSGTTSCVRRGVSGSRSC